MGWRWRIFRIKQQQRGKGERENLKKKEKRGVEITYIFQASKVIQQLAIQSSSRIIWNYEAILNEEKGE
jgi:hypothetical protein